MTTCQVTIPIGMKNVYDTYHCAPDFLISDTLYCSGQVGCDENLNVIEGIAAQYVQAFENVAKVLDAAEVSFDDVIKLETWFAEDMGNLATFVAEKDRYFTTHFPTGTGFTVEGFSMPGTHLEIKCKAVPGRVQ